MSSVHWVGSVQQSLVHSNTHNNTTIGTSFFLLVLKKKQIRRILMYSATLFSCYYYLGCNGLPKLNKWKQKLWNIKNIPWLFYLHNAEAKSTRDWLLLSTRTAALNSWFRQPTMWSHLTNSLFILSIRSRPIRSLSGNNICLVVSFPHLIMEVKRMIFSIWWRVCTGVHNPLSRS